MTAAAITIVTLAQYPPVWKTARGPIAASGDWIVLPEWGADIVSVSGQAGSPLGWANASIDVNKASGYAAGDTSIVFDGGTAGQLGPLTGSLYLEVAGTGEIIHVRKTTSTNAGVSGTFTVTRGALGTTAAAIEDDAVLYIKRTLVFTDVTLPAQMAVVHYIPVSQDYGGAQYA